MNLDLPREDNGRSKDPIARLFLNRLCFAGQQALIDRRNPTDNRAVNGDHLAGMDHDNVALLQPVKVSFDFKPIG